ncbi:Transcriptional activator GLI3 [Oryzias melastigma]|uniref:Transcriptional activator GLI3 n=1 Tax=Oryzias melastigma TaxID=30732 RepID=A0A834C050_ORYME|nr:Transcriptional activator GLI3 [Oryzias melastigma]
MLLKLAVCPQVQRFNSLNNLHPLPPLAHHPEPRNFSLQNYTRSDGFFESGLQDYTSSIAEHAALEALAMEGEGEVGLLLDDEDMLPDDLVQYLHSQVQMDNVSYNHNEDQAVREVGQHSVEAFRTSGLGGAFPGSQNLQGSERKSPGKLPIQWNEVSSGSADRSPQRERNPLPQCGRWPGTEHGSPSAPFGRFGNMVVQQQGPAGFQNSYVQADRLSGACGVNPAVKLETSPNSCMEMRGAGNNATNPFGRSNFLQVPGGAPPQVLKQKQNPNTSWQVGNNLILGRAPVNNLPQGNAPCHNRLPFAPHPPSNSSRNLMRSQQYLGPEGSGEMQPGFCQLQVQGGADQCFLACQVSGLKLENPDHGYLEENFADCLPDCKTSSMPVLEEQSLLDSIAESGGLGAAIENSGALPSPGTDQVTSTVDGHVLGALDEGANLDFVAMLEDGYDQNSLVSGVLSPSMFQGLSRTSSRLTTPRASAPFHSVAPGLNMAIGDMSSLLTSLAEESKFLAVMQ